MVRRLFVEGIDLGYDAVRASLTLIHSHPLQYPKRPSLHLLLGAVLTADVYGQLLGG
jgi:hypothetical protein